MSVVRRRNSLDPIPFQPNKEFSRSKSLEEALEKVQDSWQLDPCNWISTTNQRWLIEYPIPRNLWLVLAEYCELYPEIARREVERNFPECRGEFLTATEIHFILSRGFLPPSWQNLATRRTRIRELQKKCPPDWSLLQVSFFLELEGWLSKSSYGAFDDEIAEMLSNPFPEWIWFQFYLLRPEWSEIWRELPALISDWEQEKIDLQAIPILGWFPSEISQNTGIQLPCEDSEFMSKFLDRWSNPGFFQLSNWSTLHPKNSEDLGLNLVSFETHPICFGTWSRFWAFSLEDLEAILGWKMLNPYDSSQIWTPEHFHQLQILTPLPLPEYNLQLTQEFRNWLRNCTRVGLWVACSTEPAEQIWQLYREFQEKSIPNISPVVRQKQHWVKYHYCDMQNILSRALNGDLCQEECSRIFFWSGIYYLDQALGCAGT